MSRVIALGIDSASITLMEELRAAGSLPNLAALWARSARASLESGPAHRHGMLWPEFVTGEASRFDGDWLRLTFDPDRYEAYQETAHHRVGGRMPFWERAGIETVTFDVPRTTTSGPGVHVTSWGAHAPLHPRASSPRGLLREIDARFGAHPAFENDYECGWHDPSRMRRLTDALVTGARRRAEIVRWLMTRFPEWELFVTVLSETHSVSEFTWHGVDSRHPLANHDPGARNALERVLRAVDDTVGAIVDAAPDGTTALVFSLDGMRASHGDLPSIVLLPELMHRMRFGHALLRDPDQSAWQRAGCPPLVPRRGRPWRDDLDARLVRPLPGVTRQRMLPRVPGYQRARLSAPGRWVRERVKHTRIGPLGVPIPDESVPDSESVRDRADEMLFVGHYQPYRSAMRAFALPTFGDGYLRLNLVGRERDGKVAAADFARECGTLEDLVGACCDVRTGRPVASDIERVEGSADSERYADLVVHWSGPIDAIEHPEHGMVGPFPFHRTGTHDGTGFVWALGPRIESGELEPASVLDLPATILTLLGRPTTGTSGRPIAGVA